MAGTADDETARRAIQEFGVFLVRLRQFLDDTAQSDDPAIMAVRGSALKLSSDVEFEIADVLASFPELAPTTTPA